MAEGAGSHRQIVIGERLRAARQQRGITLEEAAVRTKIQLTVLQALESGEMVQRLGAFYAKGFLKKYGEFLNVDVQPWVDEMAQRPSKTPALAPAVHTAPARPPTPPATTPRATASPRWPWPWELDWATARRLAIIGGAVVVVALGVVWAIGAASSAWRTAQSHRQTTTSASAASRRAVAVTRPTTAPRTTVAPTAAMPLVKPGTPLTLTVLPKRDVWMRVKADGTIIFQNVLTVGTAERWRAAERFDLWVGDADALTLDLNGHDLGSPGRGVQKSLVITHEGLRRKP